MGRKGPSLSSAYRGTNKHLDRREARRSKENRKKTQAERAVSRGNRRPKALKEAYDKQLPTNLAIEVGTKANAVINKGHSFPLDGNIITATENQPDTTPNDAQLLEVLAQLRFPYVAVPLGLAALIGGAFALDACVEQNFPSAIWTETGRLTLNPAASNLLMRTYSSTDMPNCGFVNQPRRMVMCGGIDGAESIEISVYADTANDTVSFDTGCVVDKSFTSISCHEITLGPKRLTAPVMGAWY